MPIQIKRKFFHLSVWMFLSLNAFGQQPAAQDTLTKDGLYRNYGVASFYHNKFSGRKTSNGEIFSQKKLTAAHRTLPFNTRVKVTNPRNGKWIIVRINDRGPVPKKRILDLSYRAAKYLGITQRGTMRVLIEELPKKKPVGMQFGENALNK
jgi:rare lipoprotein A